MHEMSLTQGIIEICEEHSAGRKVLLLEIEIGELSGVAVEAVEFCFEACSRETVLEGAKLHILRIPGLAYCNECKAETAISNIFDPCSSCGGYHLSVIAGKEMRVLSIEVEDKN